MPDNLFQFELVSPEKLIVSKAVAMVTVPGGEGEYGVLSGHAPMITTVKAGVIEIYADDNSPASERIFVSGGFAEVTQSRCTILADEATPVSGLNRQKIEEGLRAINERLSAASETARPSLLAELDILSAKLSAAA